MADPVTSKDDPRYVAVTDPGTSNLSASASGSPEGVSKGVSSNEQHEENREIRFTTRGYYFDRLPETAIEIGRHRESIR